MSGLVPGILFKPQNQKVVDAPAEPAHDEAIDAPGRASRC
jgi:hypothetical protein